MRVRVWLLLIIIIIAYTTHHYHVSYSSLLHILLILITHHCCIYLLICTWPHFSHTAKANPSPLSEPFSSQRLSVSINHKQVLLLDTYTKIFVRDVASADHLPLSLPYSLVSILCSLFLWFLNMPHSVFSSPSAYDLLLQFAQLSAPLHHRLLTLLLSVLGDAPCRDRFMYNPQNMLKKDSNYTGQFNEDNLF